MGSEKAGKAVHESQLPSEGAGNTKIRKHHRMFPELGGDDRDRTDYLLNAIQALSQVSYAPKQFVSGCFPECLFIIAWRKKKCKSFFAVFWILS